MIIILTKILPIVIIVIAAFVFIPYFIQRIKLSKEKRTLEEQDKKLKEMTEKQKNSDKYDDFTDGHLYQ